MPQTLKKPSGLDFNRYLEYTLNSESETERLIALEELAYSGVLPNLKAKLREIARRDRSYNCRRQAEWLLAADSAKAEIRKTMREAELTPENVLKIIQNEPARSYTAAQFVRKAPPKQIIEQWKAVLKKPNNLRLAEVGIAVLTKFGSSQDASLAKDLLLSTDPQVSCAALTMIKTLDAALFAAQLKSCLSSQNFRLQMRAVSLLRQIDPNEGLKYIRFFMLHNSPIVRQQALKELMLADFKSVENLFLQYLAKETVSLLLVKAGFVAAFNPSGELPLKLYDIILLSHNDKQQILLQILKQSISSIQAAGLIKTSFNSYITELKGRIAKRRNEIILRMAIRDLASADSDTRLSAVQTLTPYCGAAVIYEALKTQLKIEQDPEIKAAISVLLKNKRPQNESAEPIGLTGLTGLTEATEPTELAVPTGAAGQTEATEPTELAVPTKAAAQTGQAEQAEPTGPTELAVPTGAAGPTEQAEPTSPAKPTELTSPAEQTEAAEPTEPTELAVPTEAAEQTGQTEAAVQTEFTVPTEAAGPTEQAERAEPPNTQPTYAPQNAEQPTNDINAPTVNQLLSADNFAALSIVEQRMLLSSVTSQSAYDAAKNKLLSILKLKCPKSVQIEILRLIESYGSPQDALSLIHFTQVGEPSVRAYALKTVGRLNLDSLMPTLNRLMADDDPRIKTAALEVYLVADKDVAVQYIISMLNSNSVKTRSLGLSLLPKLDYATAEPILLALLNKEANQELLMKTAYMIAANPTQDGLIRLFDFCHNEQGELTFGLGDIWQLGLITAESAFELSQAELEEYCWKACKAERDEMTPQKLSYSYNSVFKDRDALLIENAPPQETPLEKLLLYLYKVQNRLIVLIIIVLIYICYTLIHRQSGDSRPGSHFKAMPTSILNKQGANSNSLSTQVGLDDWKGHIKTNAGKILGGKAYASLMRRVNDDINKTHEEFEQAKQTYYERQANDLSASEETRQIAAAMANPTFYNASMAMNDANYAKASALFEQCLSDSSLNQTARLLALRNLNEIAARNNDKELANKWLSQLLKELKKTKEYSGVSGFDDFNSLFGSILKVSGRLQSEQAPKELLSGLKERQKSEKQAQADLETLKKFSEAYEKNGIQ